MDRGKTAVSANLYITNSCGCCVFFSCFSIGGWLTLAMLAGFEPPRLAQGLWFTLKPGGGAVAFKAGVVDGLGNF